MARLYLAVLLVLLPQFALAQDDAPANEDATAAPISDIEYAQYESVDFGFSLELPADGTIHDQGSEDWDKDAAVAFEWLGGEDSPVALIQGRVDRFETKLDEYTFEVFCDTLLENWSDEDRFTIYTSNRRINIAPMTWNLIEVEDNSNTSGQKVYYSVFSMFSGQTIYTVSMYYLTPISETIQEFGIPVVYSFKLAE